jgi:hypothetical protein
VNTINTYVLLAALTIAGFSAVPLEAQATTGKGCLRPANVPPGDVLNLRAKPNATSRIIAKIDPESWGVMSMAGPCAPKTIPWGQRWCPIRYTTEFGTVNGFVKARFVQDNECP